MSEWASERIGARKYLKDDDFAPFAGGTLFFSRTEDGDAKDLSLMGEFGAEYFMHKQFSVEGRIGFGFTSQERRVAAASRKETTVGTRRFGVSLNLYIF